MICFYLFHNLTDIHGILGIKFGNQILSGGCHVHFVLVDEIVLVVVDIVYQGLYLAVGQLIENFTHFRPVGVVQDLFQCVFRFLDDRPCDGKFSYVGGGQFFLKGQQGVFHGTHQTPGPGVLLKGIIRQTSKRIVIKFCGDVVGGEIQLFP